jgi:NADH-quinone oxidoreductase subunit M
MLNHGLSTGALFLLVGMLYERRHTRMISDYGGIATRVPLYTAAFLLVTFSSIGLPGLNGFVGEFLILLGAFGAQRTAAIFSTVGVVLGAAYMLWLTQRFLFGPMKREENRTLKDLSLREGLLLAPVLLLIVYMGIQPRIFLDRMAPALTATLARVPAEARGEPPSDWRIFEFLQIPETREAPEQVDPARAAIDAARGTASNPARHDDLLATRPREAAREDR